MPKMTNSCDSVIILLAVFTAVLASLIPVGLLLHEKKYVYPVHRDFGNAGPVGL